jgi:hypothetical protein
MAENENMDSIDSLDTEIKQLMEKKKALIATTSKTEPVDGHKLANGLLNVTNPVLWLKDIVGILSIRKIIIYALIIGGIYGYGYFKGIKNKPVHFNLEGKEATISLNNHKLHILPDGTAQVEDKDGKVLKKIAVKDIPELQKALMPIGISVKPFFTTGYGASFEGTSKMEAGIGTSLFKFYKVHLDTWLTNGGVYLGADYHLTTNSGILLGAGKGFAGDNRAYLGIKFNF